MLEVSVFFATAPGILSYSTRALLFAQRQYCLHSYSNINWVLHSIICTTLSWWNLMELGYDLSVVHRMRHTKYMGLVWLNLSPPKCFSHKWRTLIEPKLKAKTLQQLNRKKKEEEEKKHTRKWNINRIGCFVYRWLYQKGPQCFWTDWWWLSIMHLRTTIKKALIGSFLYIETIIVQVSMKYRAMTERWLNILKVNRNYGIPAEKKIFRIMCTFIFFS